MEMKDFSLEGKVAWVTGASYGIGFAIATAFHTAGAKIAFNDLEKGGADDQMVGPTAVALIKGDTANSVAKALFQANKDGVTITVKGALVGGELMNADQIEALSKLPTKLELISSLMGTMKAPVQKLAATLLAYVESKGGASADNA